MLFQLLLFRLGPWVGLIRCKKKRDIKFVLLVTAGIYFIGFIMCVRELCIRDQWKGILEVFFAMFPHYLCYIFAGCLIARCVWSAWSERVWKRIRRIAFMLTILGIFIENYWNSKILQIFYDFFH